MLPGSSRSIAFSNLPRSECSSWYYSHPTSPKFIVKCFWCADNWLDKVRVRTTKWTHMLNGNCYLYSATVLKIAKQITESVASSNQLNSSTRPMWTDCGTIFTNQISSFLPMDALYKTDTTENHIMLSRTKPMVTCQTGAVRIIPLTDRPIESNKLGSWKRPECSWTQQEITCPNLIVASNYHKSIITTPANSSWLLCSWKSMQQR